MAKKLLLTAGLLLVACSTGAIEVYRHQGGDGRPVEFSDKPRVGAEKFDVRVPTRTAPPATAPAQPGATGAVAPATGDQPQPYQTLEIKIGRAHV